MVSIVKSATITYVMSKVFELTQRSEIGRLTFAIPSSSLHLLRILHGSKSEILPSWEAFWQGIPDYDHLPVDSRKLLPSVIRRVQHVSPGGGWKHVHGMDLSYLEGLPRYFWTKNQFFLNQARVIVNASAKAGIRLVAFKGICELLTGGPSGMMRSTNDLDILLNPEDLDRFREVSKNVGFRELDATTKTWLQRPYPKDQFSFERTDGAKVHIDAHVVVNPLRLDNALTHAILHGCVPSGWCEGLFFPSPEERFHIAVIHAFRVGNWADGSVTKYIHDACIALTAIQPSALPEILTVGRQYTGRQDWHEQILKLVAQMNLISQEWIREIGKCTRAVEGRKFRKSSRSKGFWLNPKLVFWFQSRVQVFVLSAKAMQKQGLSWRGALFFIVSPFRSVYGILNRKNQSMEPSSAQLPPTGHAPPPPPAPRIRWSL